MKRRTPTTYRSLLAALLALALCLAPCLALAGGVNVEEARSSVFRVAVRDASGTVVSFGSAFYAGKLEDNPVLVTNYHVVSKNPEGVNLWLNAQTELHCQVLASLENTDIALLTLEDPLEGRSPLPLGTEAEAGVTVGDDVYALGFPTADISDTMTSYAEDVSVTKGVISKKSTWLSVPYYQSDVAINGGNSGGPLLHESGAVIGVCTMKMEQAEGIGGAIMIEEVLGLMQEEGASYVKLSEYTSASPDASSQPSAQPAEETVQPDASQIEETPATQTAGQTVVKRNTAGIWIGVFAVSALLFLGLIAYLLMVKKRRGAGAEGFVLPTLKKVRGYVVGKNGAYAGAIISIGNETVFFGRDPQQCQMVFDASQQQISRVHCSLRYDETLGCFLLENYSKNGTYLGDGRPIEDGRPARLESGDSFYLADSHNLFELIDKKSGPVSFWTRGS